MRRCTRALRWCYSQTPFSDISLFTLQSFQNPPNHPISNKSLAIFLLVSNSALSPPPPISTGTIDSSSAALLLLSNSFFSSSFNGSPINSDPLGLPAPNSAIVGFSFCCAERRPHQNANRTSPRTKRSPSVTPIPIPALAPDESPV